jgi:hypothetical protein
MSEDGKLIVGHGVPGAGKSTVMRRLGELIDAPTWCEAVAQREQCGPFTALMWLRSVRVPQLYDAAKVRDGGGVAIVDSYYDKLHHHVLGHPRMQWLFEERDPYFEAAREVARLDWERLPLADVIVLFELDEPTWNRFITERHRDLDAAMHSQLGFDAQDLILGAAVELAETQGTSVHRFHQRHDGVDEAAHRLRDELGL